MQSAAPGPDPSADLPVPPWRQPPARRAAPRVPLSREAIIDAALRVLDAEGYDALSMRRVAEALGTGAASLYWHVGNKEDLLQLVWDRVIGEIALPLPEPERWQEQLKEFARGMRAALQRHRGVARISLGRIPLGPNALRSMEWMFGLLAAAGLADRTIAFAGDLLSLYVDAYSYEESLGLAPADLPPDQMIAMLRDYFAALPPDRFPTIVRLAGTLTTGDADERFEFGLDLLVQGLASQPR